MKNQRTNDYSTAQKNPPADKLIGFREVNDLLGMECKTGHTARAFAARGQIRAVRVNSRVVRYSLSSVLELVAGREAA
jgi:hypothetical protein